MSLTPQLAPTEAAPELIDARWPGPAGIVRIGTLDMHTGGEPLRVITSGLPELPGLAQGNVLDKRRWFRDHLDLVRRRLMWEPRGHADMYGAVLGRSSTPGADFDVFFLHNEGYSTMCGHAILALTRLVFEAGLKELVPGVERQRVAFAVPAGIVQASARCNTATAAHANGVRASDMRFVNVPSFVAAADRRLEVPGLGEVRFDIAYGGAFYALVEAAPLGLALTPRHANALIDAGRRIKQAVMASMTIAHPFEPELGFLYGTIFTGPALDSPAHHSRNVCIFADGEVDRSATGSGVSARAALHHARGELQSGERITIESIVGSTMSVQIAELTRFGPHAAVRPEVGGEAHYSGRHEFWIEPDDALGAGFLVR